MRVKEKLNYSTLSKLPTQRASSLSVGQYVPKVGIEDIARSFERQPQYAHIANTLELISDVVFLYQLEKAINDYFSLRQQTQVSMTEAATKSQ
jgi:hypothetical protein